jgi:hypothetical protein
MHRRYACLWRKIGADAVLTEPGAAACASPDILLSMFQQHNQALPGVKALAAERLRKCRSRINQAVRDGCLEQYLAEFSAAVKKAQSTTFLRGEGARGRAGELRLVCGQSSEGVWATTHQAPMNGATTQQITERRHYHATTCPSCGQHYETVR